MADSKRNITFSELGEQLDYNPTTIRTWARKPIIGQPYDPNAINYDCINAQLAKANIDAKAKLGGVLGVDIMIDKSIGHVAGSTSIKKLNADQMQVGTTYLLISHVNRFNYVFEGSVVLPNGDMVYLFRDTKEFKKTQDAYRALTASELASDRWTIRELA